MDNNLKIEDVFIQIRDKLHKEGVKLWLMPYYNVVSGPLEEELKRLATGYSKSLNLPYESSYATLIELQSNALEKLKQINRFKESGIATIKIKILRQSSIAKIITKEILLSALGVDLKKLVAEQINTPLERIKLISGGIVVKDDESLANQRIKNSSQVLAIALNESVTDLNEDENRIRDVEITKADTSLLALDDGYMQLEDQYGNEVNIPKNEKKSLMVAIALHEKGRTALKKEDYAKALVFFLDADKEFSQCNSQLLNSVDNYALLDLDIAWCYLCLQSFVHLPEAYERLKRCEDSFHKSYGPNLERLIALKGNPGNEAALFMRLHLLQAIVLYHQNKRQEARQLFLKANNELFKLKVDEQSVITLVELGYSSAEARLGLRATNGDANMAANYINEKRSLRKESRRKAMAERIYQKERRKLGRCVDGKQYVDPNYVKMLVNMGFGREAARVALQKTNNIISDSIQYIQENPLPGPSNTKSQEFLSLVEDLIPEADYNSAYRKTLEYHVYELLRKTMEYLFLHILKEHSSLIKIVKLEAAGFDYKLAKAALQKHGGDIMMAAEELLSNKNDSDEETKGELNDKARAVERQKEKKLKEDALNRLAQDISMEDDDHLDLTLQKEQTFLNQYLALLEND